MRFKDKIAIVTGSSQGIGKATAIALAKQGAKVVINGRNADKLAKVEGHIKTITPNVLSIVGDVSDKVVAKNLIDEAVAHFGKLDILINNVGISMRGDVADLAPRVYETVFKANVMGKIYPTINALPHLRRSQGSVVFISSLAGIRGLPTLSAYSSSKMALRAITESIRIEEKQNKVHVGLVYVAVTKIEKNKVALASDGSDVVLKDRSERNVQSTEQVASSILKNISARKYVTVLSALGKINYYMQRAAPWLVERIILANLSKFKDQSE